MAKRTRRARRPKDPKDTRTSREKPVRSIPFTLPDGREVEAHNLNDVMRRVIRDAMAAMELSETQMAGWLGWTQAALNDFMNADDEPSAGTKPKGMSVYTLSKICGVLGYNNPVLLFQRHPMFAGGVDRAAYDALASVVSVTEAEDLAEILHVLRGRESVTEFLTRTRSMLGIAPKPPHKPR